MKRKELFLYGAGVMLLLLALVLEALPIGAGACVCTGPGERMLQTFSYFDLTVFGYANFFAACDGGSDGLLFGGRHFCAVSFREDTAVEKRTVHLHADRCRAFRRAAVVWHGIHDVGKLGRDVVLAIAAALQAAANRSV